MAVEREQVIEIRGQIANAPQLCLARAERNERVDYAVDRADYVFADVSDHDAPIFELKTFEQEQAFRYVAKRGERIQQPLDDQRPRHAVSGLLVRESVRVRVIP